MDNEHPPRTTSFGGRAAWNVVASGSAALSRLVVGIVIARLLGPQGTGQIAYLVWLNEVIQLVVSVGLVHTLTRYLAEFVGQGEGMQAQGLIAWIYARFLMLSVIGVTILLVVGVGFEPSVLAGEPHSLWSLVAVLFMLQSLGGLYEASLRGRQRFDRLARVNMVSSLALITGVWIGTYYMGIHGAIMGYIGGALVPALASVTLLRPVCLKVELDPRLRARLRTYTLYTWLAAILSAFVWSRMEIYFLARYWNAYEVAMFSVGMVLSMVTIQFALLVSGAFLPHFATLYGSKNIQLMHRAYASGTRLLAFILLPFAFCGAAITPSLVPMLYGADFSSAVVVSMIMVAGSALWVSTIGLAMVYGLERPQFMVVSGAVGATLSITAFTLFIPVWGSWGAALARIFVQTLMVVLSFLYIERRLSCPVPLLALARTTMAAFVSAAATAAAIQYLPQSAESIAAAVIVGVVVYLVASRIIHVLEPIDVELLMQKLSRLPNGISIPAKATLAWLGTCC